MLDAMAAIAQCAEDGLVALQSGELQALARLMDTNFDQHRGVFGDKALGACNLCMMQLARCAPADAIAVSLQPTGPGSTKLCCELCEAMQ